MYKNIPPDLKDSFELFEKAETAQDDPKLFNRYFRTAIQTIDEYLKDEPETPYKTLAKNKIKTYAKSFFGRLSVIEMKNIHEWLPYFTSIFTVIEYNIEITMNDPKIKEQLKSLWDDDFWSEFKKY